MESYAEVFNKRKQNYFSKLRKNIWVLNKLIDDNKENIDENAKRTLEILLDPKNYDELNLAEALYSITFDMISLMNRLSDGTVKEIPFEENDGIKLFIDIINKLKNKCKTENVTMTIEPTAKMIYGFLVGFAEDTEGTIMYVADKTGFDLEDDLQMQQFMLYLEKAQAIFNSKSNKTNSVNEMPSKKDIEELTKFSNEFHKLCEDGKLKKGKKISLSNSYTIHFL